MAGFGRTPDEALVLARHNRPKDRFALRYIEREEGEQLRLPPLLDKLRPFFFKQTQPIYLVGGAIRDALIGQLSHDLDFVLPQHAVRLAFAIGDQFGWPAYVLDKKRDTGRVVIADQHTTLDFARFRGPDLSADLIERDFSLNAIALPATARFKSSLIDPTNGLAAIKARAIRQTNPNAILSDPVRALRALRHHVTLNFKLADEVTVALLQAGERLNLTSVERIRDEWIKLIETAAPHECIKLLQKYELLHHIVPEVSRLEKVEQSAPHWQPVLAHTLTVLDYVKQLEDFLLFGQSNNLDDSVQIVLSKVAPQLKTHLNRQIDGGLNGRLVLRLAALFHDVGKADTQTREASGRIRFFNHDKVGSQMTKDRMRQLNVSKQLIEDLACIVQHHMRPHHLATGDQVSRRAVFRFFRDTDKLGIDICLLSLADHLAIFDGQAKKKIRPLLNVLDTLFTHYFEKFEQVINPPKLIDGNDLMQALDLKQGPELGRIIRLIKEGQAAGEITTAEEAIEFARESLN